MSKNISTNYPLSSGFTLVELSIVLVILGLLVGGIFAGQALIRSGELQAIVVDHTKYQTAADDFKKKYHALPGDMLDATDYWGASAGCGTSNIPGTCNGNGDGAVQNSASGIGLNAESYQFWRHLALAGFISGNYTGFSSTGSAFHSIIGENVPAVSSGRGGWDAGASSPVAVEFVLDYGNYLQFGEEHDTPRTLIGNALTAEEAWKIDTKLDDGKPGRGAIIGASVTSILNPVGTCAGSVLPFTNFDLPYRLDTTDKACFLVFINQF
jgi:prepilin-type N-terminal cleavage/methylation domain-containing protein